MTDRKPLPDFMSFLQSDIGKKSMQLPIGVSDAKYLQNRLQLFYDHGVFVGGQGHHLQKTIDWYQDTLVQKNEEIKQLKRKIRELKNTKEETL